MTQSIGSRRGSRTVIPQAIAGALPLTANEFVVRRALGSGEESSTTSSTSNGLLGSQTLFPSSSISPSSGGKHNISQTVLEWIFVVIALGLLTILVIWRCTYVRYRNRNAQSSLLPSSRGQVRRRTIFRTYAHTVQNPQPAHIRDLEDSTSGSAFNRHTRALVLSPTFLHTGLMPLVDRRGVQINIPTDTQPRVRGQRVRGLDVDEGGRRGGGGGGEDGNGDGDRPTEDELPAYEMGKGPPGYHVAIGNTARPDVVEVGLPERIVDEFVQHSEESPNINPSPPQELPEYASSSSGSEPGSSLPRSRPPSRDHPPPRSS